MKNFVILSAIVTTFFSLNMQASDSEDVDLAPLTNLAKQKFLEMKVPDGNRSNLQLEAFSEKKIAKLTTKYGNQNSLYTFIVQGVIDEDSKKGTFADLDGLKNGNKVTFNYSHLFFDEDAFKRVAKKSTAACDVLGKKKQEILNEILACKAKNETEAKEVPSESHREAFYSEKCKEFIKKEKALPQQCSDIDGYKKISKTFFDDDAIDLSNHRLGIEFAVGNENFKWVDDTTLASDKDSKTSTAAEIQYGYINNSFQRFDAGYRYEDKWDGEDTQQLCTPLTGFAGSLTCIDTAIGSPDKGNSRITYLQWKQYIGPSNNAAFSARISHDSETDLTGIDLPIYLFVDKETKKLQGGVRLGWVSDENTKNTDKNEDAFIFSIFFNVGFNISD